MNLTCKNDTLRETGNISGHGRRPPSRGRLLLVLEATVGGTRRHLRDLATELAARGWEVHFAYSAGRDPGFREDLPVFRRAGVALHEVPMKRGLSPVSDISAVIRLRKLIKEIRPGIVHMHSTKAGLAGRLASLFLPVIRVYSPHCFPFNMQSPLAKLYRLAEWILAPHTDMLVAVCGAEALQAAELGYKDGSIRVAYNGIDTTGTNPACLQDKRRNSVAFIGRDAKQKGLDILIEAFREVKKAIPEASLTVMSDVTDKHREMLAGLGAEIIPFSQNEAAIELLRRTEVVAIPSRWEAFPYLVLEAFGTDTAVVASDVGGIAEATADHNAALLVEGDSAHDFARALTKVLNDGGLRASLAASGRKALAEFSLARMTDSVEDAYFNLLATDLIHPET